VTTILTAFLNTAIVLICFFMICLILIQRGKGGGLAGAFGGVGGSSAFGTKSGDVFTRVTMIVATVWIMLSMILVVLYNQGGESAWGSDAAAVSKEVTPKSSRDSKSATTGSGTTKTNEPSTPPATVPPSASTPAPAPLPAPASTAPATPEKPSAPAAK
jgi:preprotein translocase subunit SecG